MRLFCHFCGCSSGGTCAAIAKERDRDPSWRPAANPQRDHRDPFLWRPTQGIMLFTEQSISNELTSQQKMFDFFFNDVVLVSVYLTMEVVMESCSLISKYN